MKFYCWMMMYINSNDYIKKLITNVDYKSIFDKIITFLKTGNKDLALEMIGYEVTLITLYFVFLPLIIENKDKEIYLGHKVSKWILYERKKNKFLMVWAKITKKENELSDMCVSWINNILLILSCVILYIFKLYAAVILVFIFFTICLCIKVSDYLKLTSSDSYKKEIEEHFLRLCNDDKDKICNMLKINTTSNILENKQTLNFILHNYDVKNMKQVYKTFYDTQFNKCDIESINMLFSTISEEILRRKKSGNLINLQIAPWDLNYFILHGMRENNFSNIYEILSIIIDYSIELSFYNNDNYNEILAITYGGISKNVIISEENKAKALKIIFNSVRYNLSMDDNVNNEFIKYKYIFNLYRYFIDKKDKKGIEFMINNLKANIEYNEKLYHNIIITLIIYLYYLIELEKPPYVKQDEKEYLKKVYQKVKSILVDIDIEFCFAGNIDNLFVYINNISDFWEKFRNENDSAVYLKTPVCNEALITAKRTLLILFRRDTANNVGDINKEDLKAFSSTIENGILKKDVLKSIQKFSEFMGIQIDNETIDDYIKSLLEYANTNKTIFLNKNNDIDYFKNEFDLIGKKLYEKIKLNKVFNCECLKNTQKYYIETTSDKEKLEYFINSVDYWYNTINNMIEEKILKIFSENKFTQINYTDDTEEVIYNKLKKLKKPYFYIRPSTDNLGSKYGYGQDYQKCILKFKIIDTSIRKKRFIIDDYKCCLKNIEFKFKELDNKEISSMIKKYKKGKYYYLKDEYNFDIKYTRDEIIKYCKDRNLSCVLVYEFGIDVKYSKGYEFVYQKKKLSK